jgi:hypothetical protein
VRFDGVDDELSFTGAVTYPSGSAGGEIWALTSQDALVADTGLRVLFDYGGSTSAYLGLIRSVVSSVNRATSAKGASASNNVNVDLSGVHVLRHIWTATGMSVEVDGTAGTGGSDSTAIASTVTLKIGSFVNSTLFWNGTINSIWLTAPLSAGQAASMLAYLKTRGGVP